MKKTLSSLLPSAIILAAGISERMGKPKCFLTDAQGRPFLLRILQAYLDYGCPEVCLVLNPQGKAWIRESGYNMPANVRILVNDKPEAGRFLSLQLGIRGLSEIMPAFIHNADNPMVNPLVLDALTEGLIDAEYVRPVFQDKGGHPVLLSCRLMSKIIMEVSHVENVRDYLRNYHQNTIRVSDPGILTNINTPEDYQKFIDTGA